MANSKSIFVTPWYGNSATGGAETICRTVANHLSDIGMKVEIYSTCSKSFQGKWKNDFPPGKYKENGLTIHRFRIDSRDEDVFNFYNNKLTSSIPISENNEMEFFTNNINSNDMMKAIKQDTESIFIFIPYLFGTTFFGCQIHPDRSVVIPCLHDEAYAKMNLMKKALSQVRAIIFNSIEEKELAHSIIKKLPENTVISPGISQTENPNPKPSQFKEKHQLENFILYGGRKDEGKNVPLLIDYFCRFLERNNTDLKLVLLGNGKATIPKNFSKNILNLTVPKEEWYDACRAASIFCLPSVKESFSIVIMEAWLNKRPVLVHNKCEVTKQHCIKSDGGLYFENFLEFEACIKYLLENPDICTKLGENGYNYVVNNYSWDKITNAYSDFFNSLDQVS